MSQNKTVIQGLEPAETKSGSTAGVGGGAAYGFYNRDSSRSAARGTIVPGMGDFNPMSGASQPQQEGTAFAQQRKNIQPGKPVVGFLYSISRTAMGEFWPLQVGRNTIGQSPTCDIVLPEGTVTGEHAVIVVRQMKNTGNIIAAITDTQSTNGTMINGETLGFTAVECHNQDVITVGNNYELVLVLVDSAKLGLSVSREFIPVEVQEAEEDNTPPIPNGGTNPGAFDPYSGPTTWGTESYSSSGTVGLDGSVIGNNHGGTQAL